MRVIWRMVSGSQSRGLGMRATEVWILALLCNTEGSHFTAPHFCSLTCKTGTIPVFIVDQRTQFSDPENNPGDKLESK